MMKELMQLQYFMVVAKFQHITKAAEKLHISQPNLSNSITRLEASLGVNLFNRKHGKISLNEYGRAYLEYVEQAFSILEAGEARLKEMTGEAGREAAVACTYATIFEEFPSLLSDIDSDECINISYSLCAVRETVQRLADKELDFAITPGPLNDPRIEWKPIYNAPLGLIVGRDHALAKLDRISLSQLKSERFICHSAGLDRESVSQICRDEGFEPTIVLESGDSSSIAGWLDDCLGVSMIPAHDIYDMYSGDVEFTAKILKLTDPGKYITVGVAKYKGRTFSPMVRKLYDYIVPYITELGQKANDFWSSY